MEYKTKISEEEIEELPNFTFDGEIIVIDHEDKIDAAVNDLSSYSHIGPSPATPYSFASSLSSVVFKTVILTLFIPDPPFRRVSIKTRG